MPALQPTLERPVADAAEGYDAVYCELTRAVAEADDLVSRARTALSVLPMSVEREALDALAEYVTRRGH